MIMYFLWQNTFLSACKPGVARFQSRKAYNMEILTRVTVGLIENGSLFSKNMKVCDRDLP